MTQELGATLVAIGQLVHALGDWIGHPPLHQTRSGKERLTLVNETQDVLREVTQGLDGLESGLNKLRDRQVRSMVIVTTSQVLMMNWLMSRLNRFSQVHKNIELCSNVTEKLMDTAHGEVDLDVRCDKDDWPRVNKTWLMDEEMALVCSSCTVPVGKISCGERLAVQRLIHDNTPHPGVNPSGWNDVLAVIQVPATRDNGLYVNPISTVILAALSGQGVVIMRRALVQQLLTDG